MSQDLPPITKLEDTKASKRRPWTARAASFVCPGLGQLMEKRYLKGGIQMGIFMTALTIMIIELIRWLFANVEIALSYADGHGTFVKAPLKTFLIAGAIALIDFAWSLWDAGRAQTDNAPEQP